MNQASSSTTSCNNKNVILSPSPRLPLMIIFLGIALIPIHIMLWLLILIISFGVFLLIQTFTLRLEFTTNALVVNQMGNELRRFPYKSWLAWRLFSPGFPVILYFREEASPHLLPVLFDPKELKLQLQDRLGQLERPQKEISKTSKQITNT